MPKDGSKMTVFTFLHKYLSLGIASRAGRRYLDQRPDVDRTGVADHGDNPTGSKPTATRTLQGVL